MTLADRLQALVALVEAGDFPTAATDAQAVLQEAPEQPAFWHILGTSQAALGALADSAYAFEQVTRLRPKDAAGHYNLGCMLQQMDETKAAIEAFSKAVALDSTHAQAFNNLGNVLRRAGRLTDALKALQRARELAPASVDVAVNLISTLRAGAALSKAMTLARNVLAQRPDHAQTRALLFRLQGDQADLTRYADFAPYAEDLGITGPALPPFSLIQLEDHPTRLRQRIERWSAAHFPKCPPQSFAPRRSDKLRIGYFSANFHDHPGMYLTGGLFRSHDHAQFDVLGYSLGAPRQSALREAVIGNLTEFHDVHALSEAKIAAVARQHALDIAIDLDGHTKGARLGVFAHRVAPVQLSFLGFPGPISSDFFDYCVADAQVLPAQFRDQFPEKILFMPHSYMPADNALAIGPATTRAAHDLPEGAFVLCCLNDGYKIGQVEFEVWMRAMSQAPDSVLWLMDGSAEMRTNLCRAAQAQGIDSDRLIFAPRLPHDQHLERYRHADLFVDTFIYNAHTTACDALWAGLPLVTKSGAQFASRAASSLLHAVGMPELVTQTPQDYEDLIRALMQDRSGLAALRAKLGAQLTTSPFFDSAQFARDFEAGLREMYAIYEAKDAPRDIWVGQTP